MMVLVMLIPYVSDNEFFCIALAPALVIVVGFDGVPVMVRLVTMASSLM